mgnify:CR=1 FL=1
MVTLLSPVHEPGVEELLSAVLGIQCLLEEGHALFSFTGVDGGDQGQEQAICGNVLTVIIQDTGNLEAAYFLSSLLLLQS